MFIHGLAGDHTSFKKQINYFKKDYSILAVDLKGHGQSPRPKKPEKYKSSQILSELVSLLEKQTIITPNLVGFSLGGYFALRLAIEKGAGRVITINPVLRKESLKKSFFLKLKLAKFLPRSLLKRLVGNPDLSEYKNNWEIYVKHLIRTPPHILEKIVKNIEPINKTALKEGFYMIQSTQDEIINHSFSKSFNCIKKKIKGSHYVIGEKPRKVNRLIKRFLERSPQEN